MASRVPRSSRQESSQSQSHTYIDHPQRHPQIKPQLYNPHYMSRSCIYTDPIPQHGAFNLILEAVPGFDNKF